MISVALVVEVAGHATGHDDIAHQAMTERGVRGAQHGLAQHAAMRMHQREGGVVADGADIAEVIGKPLEFGEQRTEPDRAIGHDEFQCGFGGLRKCVSIGDGAVARHPSGELDGSFKIGSNHEPLDALVGVSQPLLQPDHGLAACGKPEMSGLDDPRVHGTDRDLVHAVALHRQEAVGRRLRSRTDVISQRKSHIPIAVIEPGAGIGQALRRQPEQVVHRSFQPKRRRVVQADRRIGVIGAIQAQHGDFRRSLIEDRHVHR